MTNKQRERSVAIAKDVLKQIKHLRIVRDRYMVFPDGLFDYTDIGRDMQSMLPRLFRYRKKCRVCALGACMLSHVKLYDKFNLPGAAAVWDHSFRDNLVSAMGERNTCLIETAFEKASIVYFPDEAAEHNAIAFGRQYKNDADRLVAIMKAVIKNKGEFIPEAKKAKRIAA